MAKIKERKMHLKLDAAQPWKETLVATYYDATDKKTATYRRDVPENRFYIKLPQVVADSLGVKEVRAADQDAAETAFLEALEKYKNLKTETNRIIIYHIDVDPDPNPEDKSSWSYRNRQVSNYHITVWAGAYEETIATAGDGQKRYAYTPQDSPLNFHSGDTPGTPYYLHNDGKRNNRQIPWTPQNEAFFVWVKANMLKLIEGLSAIKSPNILLDMVNAGRLLPLGTKEDKDGSLL